MHSIIQFIKNIPLYAAIGVLGSFTLMTSTGAVFADAPAPCSPTPHPDSYYGAGVHHPNGTDGSSYTYHCETDTWSNPYYVYYPATATKAATFDRNYSFNCTTGTWTMDEWGYSPATGSFNSYRVAAGSPGLATNCPPPAAPTPPISNEAGTGSTGSGVTGTITNTGSNSTNSLSNNASLNGSNANNTSLTANNGLISIAGTGNAGVSANTVGGSASTGNAQAIANIANLLQSTSNVFGPNTTVFNANINGDVNGDFMFDPSAIMNTGSNSANSATNNLAINTNNSNNLDAQINNDINVGAASGNANVTDNTKAGDATTGNAQAVVNLMNLINSSVSAGGSFVGNININGNLNGDILLPQGVIDQLLTSTGRGSSNEASNNYTDNSTTTNNVAQAIQNNILSTAVTGNASVGNNTTGGTATSGQAQSGVTMLNLTGSNTIGKNSLLVFVNVLGKWVGMIMNAPSGTDAAQLGGGITESGGNSTNILSNNITDNSTTDNNASLGITNNVNVGAKSGDATVASNTIGGNAKSGDASTAVNILNLTGSNLNLSDWFGVLFINVFGMWNGSFGVNTSAGDPINKPTNNTVQAANQQSMLNEFRQFASFNAHTPTRASSPKNISTPEMSAVLGTATTVSKKILNTSASTNPTPDNAPHASYVIPMIGAGLALLILVASERSRFFGKKN